MVKPRAGIRRGALAVALVLSMAASASEIDVAALEQRLRAARCAWDVEAVRAVLWEARGARSEGDVGALRRLQVSAGLALAEMLRLEFEDAESRGRKARAGLGQRIDTAAGEALELLDGLPESSETCRMKADLLATMMRSRFRGRKYRKELDAAIARALELDGQNPRALVTAAKPLLFAGPGQGGDLEGAKRLLDRALELDAGLESALLLRAHAHESMGEAALAAADRAAALDRNPDCGPAIRVLVGAWLDPG